ncbi:hypothetical protein H3H36_02395 [Duganella sp. FT3S]|uniref:Uncharacterized protein n=1 Tax=Rugamonas fusca TaxID=2758568 RepID=A0A7W2EE05_9BURK|nr:hypothetical protein [Rugamonas fusca]MBA5604213.1 hypothetical protein [Rugamonas fusca]
MTKSILLARPHPFIVTDMMPFLTQAGFRVVKPEGYANLATLARSCTGAVVSLAISSSVPESAAEVYQKLRAAAPALPVLFAGISSLDSLRGSMERIAQQAGMQAAILGISAANERTGGLGKSDTLLYVSKEDLADTARRQMAARMVLRHLR